MALTLILQRYGERKSCVLPPRPLLNSVTLFCFGHVSGRCKIMAHWYQCRDEKACSLLHHYLPREYTFWRLLRSCHEHAFAMAKRWGCRVSKRHVGRGDIYGKHSGEFSSVKHSLQVYVGWLVTMICHRNGVTPLK